MFIFNEFVLILDYMFLFLELEEEWWADDVSDFDLDSDFEGEGDRFCNIVMLIGFFGVGKIVFVYVLV